MKLTSGFLVWNVVDLFIGCLVSIDFTINITFNSYITSILIYTIYVTRTDHIFLFFIKKYICRFF